MCTIRAPFGACVVLMVCVAVAACGSTSSTRTLRAGAQQETHVPPPMSELVDILRDAGYEKIEVKPSGDVVKFEFVTLRFVLAVFDDTITLFYFDRSKPTDAQINHVNVVMQGVSLYRMPELDGIMVESSLLNHEGYTRAGISSFVSWFIKKPFEISIVLQQK